MYRILYTHYGPQHWWPADTSFEMMVGAILTQNTNWGNVEKALDNLKKAKALTADRLGGLSKRKVAALIKPAGYYNIKTQRLKAFVDFFSVRYGASIKKMSSRPTDEVRRDLLAVHGVGKETADSMLLYALHKPVFVVDAYTKRILTRHGLLKDDAQYDQVQDLFMKNLDSEVELFNEYHALLVRVGKEFCAKKKPKCEMCPLGSREAEAERRFNVKAQNPKDKSNSNFKGQRIERA
jgi:endonuclease III related protein